MTTLSAKANTLANPACVLQPLTTPPSPRLRSTEVHGLTTLALSPPLVPASPRLRSEVHTLTTMALSPLSCWWARGYAPPGGDGEISVGRDEVGLIRVITVKARSSAKRTEMLKQLQSKDGSSCR
ncbi:hypothetical protein B0H34DRAFT_524683 [Crassisporium funariophilum]|nr:hypothetical protein B0H34DRAFT_524683 [Crassisporium funariophilum]